MRAIKTAKWLIRILIALSLLLIISVFLILSTPTGTQLAIKIGLSFIPSSIQINTDRLSGTLLTTVHANITYSQDSIKLAATDAQIKINLLSLLSGQINLSSVQTQSLAITTRANQVTKTQLNPNKSQTSLINHFFIPEIFINHLSIKKLIFKNNTIKSITGNAYLHASRNIINISAQAHGYYHSHALYLSTSGYGPINQFKSHSTLITHQNTIKRLKLTTTGQGDLTKSYQLKITGNILKSSKIDGVASFNISQAHWQTQLTVSSLNLAELSARYPSTLNIHVSGHGNSQSGQLNTDIQGTLFKQVIKGQAKLDYNPQKISFDIQAHNGNNAISLTGTPERAKMNIALNQIDHILPGSTGKINLQGRLNHNKITATATINNLLLNTPEISPILNHLRIKQARLNISTSQSEATVALFANNLTLLKLPIKNITSRFKLKSRQFSLSTHIQARKLILDQQATGTLNKNNQVNLTLHRFNLKQQNNNIDWALSKPVLAKFHLQHLTKLAISPFILTNKKNNQRSVSFSFKPLNNQQQDQIRQLQVKLVKFPLNLINQISPNKLQLTGSLSGTLDLQLKFNQHSHQLTKINAKLTSSAGKIRTVNPTSERIKTVAFQPLSLLIQGDQKQISSQMHWQLGHDDHINGQINLKNLRTLSGRIDYSLKAVNILGFIPEINIQHPTLTGTFSLSGNITQPKLTGQTTLTADLYLPITGIELKQTSLTLTANGSPTLAVKAKAMAGSGSLSLTGIIDITHLLPQVTLNIQGKNAQLMDLPYATLHANPNISIAYNNAKDLVITGDLHILKGDIHVDQVPQNITLPTDIKIVGDQQNPALNIHTDINLELDKNIFVTGYGLKTNIEGKLNIISTPNQLTRANGNLKLINGTYKLLGQNLNITQGQLIFGGNAIQNPGLNINIERKITPSNPTDESITTGVKVTGNLNKPTLTPYSTPTMSKADILSYLLFGTPVPQTSSGNAAILAQLVTSSSLFNTGTGGIVQNIKKTLGLSELGIQSNAPATQAAGQEQNNLNSLRSTTSLVLGKYLAPDLYVSYSVGFLGQQIASIRYQLNQNWSVNTEAGTTSAVDLFYNIEKN
ncbi:translocation/assembly module TamB domain-containing protein [Piscirickettsia litoralis]|uniref:Translocation and assembly module TamB C-terminal domain-containing protein n=1 Tax=Piscirickettsia litoralis TaxID=1891921 RepID=A0ABX3A2Q4_9GAMM|nr:translocation/assembly module TamB domain-containing protein [Piscirickettsia litoralis]ODN41660.1 hypothetical protein BGC07_00010 [Piscirickettsia litoralis]